MTDVDKYKKWTEEAMLNLQAGDSFTEMLAFWVIIVSTYNDNIISRVGYGDSWKVEVHHSSEAFRAKYAYGSIPGYSVWMINQTKSPPVGGRVDLLRSYLNVEDHPYLTDFERATIREVIIHDN